MSTSPAPEVFADMKSSSDQLVTAHLGPSDVSIACRLPEDVLLAIIAQWRSCFSFSNVEYNPFTYYYYLFRLRSVSSQWRALIDGRSRLWDIVNQLVCHPEARQLLARNRGDTIQLTIVLNLEAIAIREGAAVDAAVGEILSLAPRWDIVNLRLTPRRTKIDKPLILKIISAQAPRLRTFTCFTKGKAHKHKPDFEMIFEDGLFQRTARHLECLTFSCYGVRSVTLASFPELREIRSDHLPWNLLPTAPEELWDTLAALPKLRLLEMARLSMWQFQDPEITPFPALHILPLPAMEHIILWHTIVRGLLAFLSHIQAPRARLSCHFDDGKGRPMSELQPRMLPSTLQVAHIFASRVPPISSVITLDECLVDPNNKEHVAGLNVVFGHSRKPDVQFHFTATLHFSAYERLYRAVLGELSEEVRGRVKVIMIDQDLSKFPEVLGRMVTWLPTVFPDLQELVYNRDVTDQLAWALMGEGEHDNSNATLLRCLKLPRRLVKQGVAD